MKRAIAFTTAVVLKSIWLAVVIWAWPAEARRSAPGVQAAETRDAGDPQAVVFVEPGAAQ
jgi:hypothetical protein